MNEPRPSARISNCKRQTHKPCIHIFDQRSIQKSLLWTVSYLGVFLLPLAALIAFPPLAHLICIRDHAVNEDTSILCYINIIAWFRVQFGLLIINLAKLTVHYIKYEYVWDSQVYGIQVYSILYSLQQVVATYKLDCQVYSVLTNQWAITLFHCCSANQWAITLFFYCLYVQENTLHHYLAFIPREGINPERTKLDRK